MEPSGGNQVVYVNKQTKQSIAGPAEWTDVFLKVGADDPLNVSQCDGVNCGQPSLCSDGRFVVFIWPTSNKEIMRRAEL